PRWKARRSTPASGSCTATSSPEPAATPRPRAPSAKRSKTSQPTPTPTPASPSSTPPPAGRRKPSRSSVPWWSATTRRSPTSKRSARCEPWAIRRAPRVSCSTPAPGIPRARSCGRSVGRGAKILSVSVSLGRAANRLLTRADPMSAPKTLLQSLLLVTLTGCTVIGTGHRTIVRARCDLQPGSGPSSAEKREALRAPLCSYLASRYPHLIASSESPDESLILQIDPKGKPLSSGGSPSQPAYAEFSEFLRLKYGRADFRPVELSFNSHDRTVTPAFVRSDLRSSLAANLATLFTGDSKSTVQERIDRQKLLEGCSAIGQVYYYYPRLSVDFSSSFLPVSAPDHLSYLVLVVRLKEGDTTSERPLRFLDITPKDADLVGFSRGDFNQSLQLTASASTGNKVTGSQAVGQAPLTTSTGKESSLGASTGATFTEGFATKLV